MVQFTLLADSTDQPTPTRLAGMLQSLRACHTAPAPSSSLLTCTFAALLHASLLTLLPLLWQAE
eukprot:6196717-Pleurochrysis_carterae.AAC.1